MMGYKVIADKYQMDEMRTKYGPRTGLEGPFLFSNGQVLYYDSKQGQYYDPRSDFYMSNEDMEAVHQHMVDLLKA
jgi:hypothetical protein